MPGRQKVDWEEFAGAIARAGRVPAGAIARRSRLVEDLALDSLALSEVIVMLLVEMEMSSLEDDLASREWERVTAGELFEEYRQAERPARGGEYVIRKRRS